MPRQHAELQDSLRHSNAEYGGTSRELGYNGSDLTRFNNIAIQGTPQMAVDKEAICLSRVYSYYPKCNFPLIYV